MALIKDLIDSSLKRKTIWVRYIDDFEIELRFLSRGEMLRILEDSREWHWDREEKVRKEQMRSEKFYREIISKGIINWRGLKAKTLAKMIPVKFNDPEMEIPFSPDNAFELIREAYDFDLFIQATISDIERFQAKEEETEIKN